MMVCHPLYAYVISISELKVLLHAVMTAQSKTSPTAISYKASGGFETSTGTLYVSKPYRSTTSKKLRALITFAPRKSVFDINNDRSSTNEFRVRPKPSYPNRINLSTTPSLGVFLSILDIPVLILCAILCAQYRNQWASTQPSFCCNVFARCDYPGSKRCVPCPQHWYMCTIRACHEEWMDTLLLDGPRSSASPPNHDIIWGYLLDI
jgi:hypothetical protein